MTVDPQSIFELYEDIAVEVVDSTASNDDVHLPFTNRELSEQVCRTMGWEDFDLFETHDFEKVIDAGDPKVCLAYAFLSFLRWRMFLLAQDRGIGIAEFNEKAAAYSEYWYIKLVEKWNESNPNGGPIKAWLQ